MVRQNQGFRKDLNLQENTNDVQTLNNLGGAGIADDLRIIQNNLRNISTLAYNSLSNEYFFFGSGNDFVFTKDDVVTVNTNVSVGTTILTPNNYYYVCNSDGQTKFKLSYFPSRIGVSTIVVTTVSSPSFYFIRKNTVTQENLQNFVPPEIKDIVSFGSYLDTRYNVNRTISNIQNQIDAAEYLITKKYKGSENTTVDTDITTEGAIVIADPAKLNTGSSGLNDPKSPGIFINSVRAFSNDNNPWNKVGTALSTSSSSVNISNLNFSDDISISGISTETATEVAVTTFTHKLPVVINGETYYLLLRT
jgi:hypothetical protein